MKENCLRSVCKPHSVLRVAPHVRSSLWAARHRSAQCNLPGTDTPISWECAYEDEQSPAIRRWLRPYLVLLPAGVTWTIDITTDAGGLLHHLFTLTSRRSGIATCFCGPHPAGLFLNGDFPAPGAIRRRALWSADFPRPRQRRAAIARPT